MAASVAAVPVTPISQISEINKRVTSNLERNTLRVAVGYTIFALSTLTFWKVIAVAIIITNVNGSIAEIISKIQNSDNLNAYKNDYNFYCTSLNLISMLAIGYIHSAPLINFIKYGI
jgi:hypothetical protein